jgi:AcrR family transcriptional regulator
VSRTGSDEKTRAGAAEAPARGRGRPRSAEAEQAILEATLRLVAEHGVAHLTIEGVAAEAGVGKTTIYRRWETKTELIIAAVSQLAPPPGEFPDAGSFVGDMQALGDLQRRRTAGSLLLTAAPRVLADAADDPELHAGFVQHVVKPLRAMIAAIVERAQARGELRSDIDVEAVVDLIHALPIYRLLLSGGDSSVLDGIGPKYMPLIVEGIRKR